MYKKLLLVVFVLANVLCYSQDVRKKVDSLEDILAKYTAAQDFRKMIMITDEIVQILPCSFGHLEKGWQIANQLKDTSEMIRYVNSILKCTPDHPMFNSIYGYLLMRQGKPYEAMPYVEMAMKLEQNDARIKINYAHALWLTGRNDKAKDVYRSAIRITFSMADMERILFPDLVVLSKHYPSAGIDELSRELTSFASATLQEYASGNQLQLTTDAVLQQSRKSGNTEPYLLHLARIIDIEERYPSKRTSLLMYSTAMMADVLLLVNRPEDAISMYQYALACARDLSDNKHTTVYNTRIADVFAKIGLTDSAYRYYESAIAGSKKYNSADTRVSVYIALGNFFRDYRSELEALYVYLMASELVESHHLFGKSVLLDYEIGNLYMVTANKPDSAFVFYNRAYQTAYQYNLTASLHLADMARAKQAIHNRAYYKAAEYLNPLYINNALDDGESVFRKIEFLYLLGLTNYHLGKTDQALQYLEKAENIIVRMRSNLSEKARLEFYSRNIDVNELITACNIQKGNYAAVFEKIEQSKTLVLSEKMNISTDQRITLDSVMNRIKDNQIFIVFGFVESDSKLKGRSMMAITNKSIKAFHLTDSAFMATAASYAYGSVMDTLISAMKEAMEENIPYTYQHKELRLFNVLYNLALSDAAGQKRASVKPPDGLGNTVKGKWVETLSRLYYRQFFQPIEHLAEGKKELIIMSDGDLNFIPFESLMNEQGKYLGERFTIKYLPSFKVAKGLAERPAHDSLNILAFGNPVYNKLSAASHETTPVRQYYASVGAEWQSLPGTAKELDSIVAMYPATETFRQSETEEYLFKVMDVANGFEKYAVLHFATHGYVSGEHPEYSALVLNQTDDDAEDGYLTAAEIEKMKIPVDLVVLSACETGLGMIKPGEGVLGMASAFFVAGAKSLIVSMWSVSDDATNLFMTNMYREVKMKGVDFKTAMQLTRQKFIRGDYGEEYKKPYYWAPFVYYGN